MDRHSNDWELNPQRHVAPVVTIAVPSFNQGQFLNDALSSIFSQNIPVEVFVADGGSTDDSLAIIHQWASHLAGWRSGPDGGQAAAINEAVAMGTAPYVCWLNSDDAFLPNALNKLLAALQNTPNALAVYGQAWNTDKNLIPTKRFWTEAFSPERMALRNIIAQPATLIRRTAWEALSGVRTHFHLSMDYDLWWRLYKNFGPLTYLQEDIALNRVYPATKTNSCRKQNYCEAIAVVREHYGWVPSKWWLAWPYAVWWRSFNN